ncbi:hypothetical protein [Prosthecobacter sp.]|uniref:hypothetical protein n=1 Tax=Prosthecobacter sp. TaxID=1965333 RepID=UPI00378488EB
MIDFFAQQCALFSKGVDGAVKSKNYYLATLNIGQAFNASVMQGLIGWRCGLMSPVESFKKAVRQLSEGVRTIESFSENNCSKDLPIEKAVVISFLVDLPLPTLRINDLRSDRLLDAVLGNGLCRDWDESAWNTGLAQLKQNKRATLAVKTYTAYNHLRKNEGEDLNELIEHAESFFQNRAKDAFFSGGDETDGGGPDNDITIDYRLAAIMKKIGYNGGSAHRWQWS